MLCAANFAAIFTARRYQTSRTAIIGAKSVSALPRVNGIGLKPIFTPDTIWQKDVNGMTTRAHYYPETQYELA